MPKRNLSIECLERREVFSMSPLGGDPDAIKSIGEGMMSYRAEIGQSGFDASFGAERFDRGFLGPSLVSAQNSANHGEVSGDNGLPMTTLDTNSEVEARRVAFSAFPELDANGNGFAPLKPAELMTHSDAEASTGDQSDRQVTWQTNERRLIVMPDPAVRSASETLRQ